MFSGKKDYLNSLTKGSGSLNVIIIIADDLGRNDMALYDEVNGFKTLNLAESAVYFTDAYAALP